jgi:hypothetical protein
VSAIAGHNVELIEAILDNRSSTKRQPAPGRHIRMETLVTGCRAIDHRNIPAPFQRRISVARDHYLERSRILANFQKREGGAQDNRTQVFNSGWS